MPRTLYDKNPTFDDSALEAKDFFLRLCGKGGGPSNIVCRELASAVIEKKHAHDSPTEVGRTVRE